jgi:predicted ATPase/class 3 adenylate cyclase
VIPGTQEDADMRGDLPTGTVTFLFTDIEGSTRLLHELGTDDYAAALGQHRLALRAAFARHGGVEVDTQGDAFFFAFRTAPEAVAAAAEGQEALATGPIRVRMGLHTGTPQLTDEGYVGADVHRAARIAGVAHGGQVVLSSSTSAFLDPSELLDLGLHRLKDLSAADRIHQLGKGSFPPLRSLYRSNLPVPATPFIGRDRDTAAVLELFADGDCRLITLTGPGGAGKSRLALQVAALASEGFPDGVFWVPLAAVTDAALVPTATTAAIGSSGSLAEWIGDKRLFLVLDNLEHLLAAAGWVAELLSTAPHLHILVTSREPLRIAAEHQYDVSSLDPSESLALFTARALAVDPGFRPDRAVIEICVRLDHLPLAIELAAARVKVLPTAQLLSRLDERLQLLTSGPRDAPARQRTLRATLAWSHDLLNDAEKATFRRLAVFAGGCTLEAAEKVIDADLETLESLVDKSLVRRSEDRLWMLETIREYALERLAADDDAAELRRRHSAYFAALAESTHLSVEGSDLGQSHELAIPEIPNLRAAIDEAESTGDRTLALSIAVALEQLWVVRSPDEGRQRLTALLYDLPATVPPLLQARALRVLGGVTYIVGDFDTGVAYILQALDMFRDLGDENAVGHLLVRIALEAMRVGDRDEALRLLTEAESLPARRSDEAQQLSLRAQIAWQDNATEEALQLLRRAADAAGEVGFTWWQGNALLTLADYALELGKPELAIEPMIEVLELGERIGNRLTVAYALTLMARHATESGDDVAAGTWWAAVEAESQRAPIGQWDADRAELARGVLRDTDEFASGLTLGRSMTLTEANQSAVDSLRPLVSRSKQPPG